jgi:hypothetical protein
MLVSSLSVIARDVATFDSRFAQAPRGGAAALHDLDVERCREMAGAFRVALDHDDVVPVLGKALGEGRAPETAAHDQNVHATSACRSASSSTVTCP